jgi:hypothetical protein
MNMKNYKWLPVSLGRLFSVPNHYILAEIKWLLKAFCLTCTVDQVAGSIVLLSFAEGSILSRLLRFWQAYDWPMELAALLFTARQIHRYINNRKHDTAAKAHKN